ncbi:SPOR domain-containing protein [Undibacterium sp. 14-3-2]|uniref:SPOR domain-containing protein n=1 Tax=Undibacterium sp. 14-3-2 TaxID=2800129 RepID=UPI0019072BAB|nr:SPOR domain-containing protein [Undibacterium sp. 14-3-2]MBK1891689.1 SPOR domain-containing protein [Undibacterium sp. 14-3-2]
MGLLSRFKQKQETSDSQDSGEFRSRSEEDSVQSRARSKKTESARKNKINDPILPEKKRARRRLIGAMALALAAIIGLPMILDSEPKPLADDVNIRIPAKDKVTDIAANQVAEPVAPRKSAVTNSDAVEEIIEPVSSAKSKPATDVVSKVAPAKTDVATVIAKSDKPVVTEPRPERKVEAKTEVKPETKSETKQEPKQEPKPVAKPAEKDSAKAERKAEPKPEHKVDVKPEPKAETKLVKTNGNDDDAARALAILEGKAPPKVAKPEAADKSSFVVQVAVLSTQEKVDELQAKLKSGGIKSYTQKVPTASGDKTRIRVGPFESRDEAEKMRAKLTKLGLSGSLVPN